MDDILASIRKIIDEDDKKVSSTAPAGDETPNADADEDDILELEEIVDDDEDDDEPLELTEVIEGEASEETGESDEPARPIVEASDEQPAGDAGEEPSTADMTNAGAAEPVDEPVQDTPDLPDAEASGNDRDTTHTPRGTQDEAVADAVPEVEDETPPPSQEDTMSDDGLMSEQARTSAAVALGSLAKASKRDALDGVPRGRPVEDLVMEQLTPMLSQWLDDHLPAIVERVVEREVRYLSRRLGGGDET